MTDKPAKSVVLPLDILGRRYLTTAQLADALGVSPRTIGRWNASHIGPPRLVDADYLTFKRSWSGFLMTKKSPHRPIIEQDERGARSDHSNL
jgi:hypothetical protein